jgi:hypothetical protein
MCYPRHKTALYSVKKAIPFSFMGTETFLSALDGSELLCSECTRIDFLCLCGLVALFLCTLAMNSYWRHKGVMTNY